MKAAFVDARPIAKFMIKLADHSIASIVLAAGRGRRMRRMSDHPKLLLPLHDGKPILWHAIRSALAFAPSELVVVVRPDLPALADALIGLPVRCVPNPLWEEGMATSLGAGIEALGEDVEAAMVMLGDEPYVREHIVEKLIEAYARERKLITMPLYGNQTGPPSLFAREVFSELLRLQGDVGGRQLLTMRSELACLVPFSESERPKDIDTPNDYGALL